MRRWRGQEARAYSAGKPGRSGFGPGADAEHPGRNGDPIRRSAPWYTAPAMRITRAFYSWYLIKTVFLRTDGGARGGAKYRKSRISRIEAERYRSIIDELMERDAPYRYTGFTLDRLAARSGLSRNHLSQVLNDHYGASFYDFVNAYRIRDAKRLLSDPDCGLSVLEVAFEAGFNSKTAFYAAFKKTEKANPVEFRERSAAERRASSG